MHASVTVGTLVLEVPLVNGSGVVDARSSDDGWNVPAAQLGRLGAFFTKTLTRTARAGSAQPWAEVLDEGTLLNAAGLPNPGVEAAMRDWGRLPDELGVPVVVSIEGRRGEVEELCERVTEAGWASAIELNLSCPNVAGGLVAADPAAAADVVARARARTDLPLFAKLTAACGDPGAVGRAAVAAGADALTCGNTMPARMTDGSGAGLLGAGAHGGLSGRALHAINLRLVAEVAAAVDVPIIGLGGVDGLGAADRMLDAGATIVGVGTGAVVEPGLIELLSTHLEGVRSSTAT